MSDPLLTMLEDCLCNKTSQEVPLASPSSESELKSPTALGSGDLFKVSQKVSMEGYWSSRPRSLICSLFSTIVCTSLRA
jgi:hypothetical protein